MNNIYLLGFMGSGKSYLGQLLAQELQWPFIDLDEWILNSSPYASIPELFEKEGEAAFRQREAAALLYCSQQKQHVVATGGGTPCFFDNMSIMKATGLTIFLNPPITELCRRLGKERTQRPLIADLKESELKDFIKELMKKRTAYYEQAAWEINNGSNVLKKLVERVTAMD